MPRFQSAQYFLTYPRCDEGIESLWAYLITYEPNGAKPVKLLIAEETHEDGGKHLHAYVKYNEKLNSRNPRLFDFNGHHGNYQTARSAKAVIGYCTKDGNYKANFDIKVKISIKQLIEECSSPDQFINEVVSHCPDLAIRSFSNVRSLAEWKFRVGAAKEPLRPLTEFEIPDAVTGWITDLENHTVGERDMQCLWLWGPSRLGKTQLARSIGKHIYIQGIWNFDNLSDDAKYCVIDDVEWDSIKYNMRQLVGIQSDVTFTGKYKRPTTFKWGIPTIFVTNELPIFSFSEQTYMDVNCLFVHIKDKLF